MNYYIIHTIIENILMPLLCYNIHSLSGTLRSVRQVLLFCNDKQKGNGLQHNRVRENSYLVARMELANEEGCWLSGKEWRKALCVDTMSE